MDREIADHVPALVVQAEELAGLDASASSMRRIPGSRMFEIRDALQEYRRREPEGAIFDASQGDGGADQVDGFVDELADRRSARPPSA